MKQDIEIVRGTTNTFEVLITDNDGEPYQLSSNDKVYFGIKRKPTDLEPIFSKEGINGEDGQCVIILKPEDTINLAGGRYYYDVGLQHGIDFFNIIPLSILDIIHNVTSRGDFDET